MKHFKKDCLLNYCNNILPPRIQYKAYQEKVRSTHCDVIMDVIPIIHEYDDSILYTKQSIKSML